MILSRLTLTAMVLAGFAAPVTAQRPTPSAPATQAADARERPVTDALNTGVEQHLQAQAAITADQQAQYDLDRAAYRAAIRARAAEIGQDQAQAARQEDAYARAMIVWRIQTDECTRGILKSCKKPTPRPADFY